MQMLPILVGTWKSHYLIPFCFQVMSVVSANLWSCSCLKGLSGSRLSWQKRWNKIVQYHIGFACQLITPSGDHHIHICSNFFASCIQPKYSNIYDNNLQHLLETCSTYGWTCWVLLLWVDGHVHSMLCMLYWKHEGYSDDIAKCFLTLQVQCQA